MAKLEFTQSTQFTIKKLAIDSKLSKEPIDISSIFEELNIFDSILTPCMSGNILLNDSVGLSKRLIFDGTEYLHISISKSDEASDGNLTNLTKSFRIFKQTNRKNTNQSTESYVLHFVSEEMIYSAQQKISQSFTGIYSDIANSILKNYLKVPKDKIGIIENTKGIHNAVVPLLSPIDAMNWLAKRTVSNNSSADFLFFENQYGFNFVSLDKLFSIPPIFSVNFLPKNILSDDITSEFFGVRDYSMTTSFDILENTRNGFYANRFVGFDILTRTLVEKDYGLRNHYKGNHLNDNPSIYISNNREGKDAGLMPFSKVNLYPFQKYRSSWEYVNSNDTSKSLMIDDTHEYIPRRKAILNNLAQRKMTITLPGNFAVTSGYVLNVDAKSFAINDDVTEQYDKSVSGKYLIVATRHMINPQKHETFCEIATDSTNNELVASTTRSI